MKINKGEVGRTSENILIPENDTEMAILSQVLKDAIKHWTTKLQVEDRPEIDVELNFPHHVLSFNETGETSLDIVMLDENSLKVGKYQIVFSIALTEYEREFLTVYWKTNQCNGFAINDYGSSLIPPMILFRTELKV